MMKMMMITIIIVWAISVRYPWIQRIPNLIRGKTKNKIRLLFFFVGGRGRSGGEGEQFCKRFTCNAITYKKKYNMYIHLKKRGQRKFPIRYIWNWLIFFLKKIFRKKIFFLVNFCSSLFRHLINQIWKNLTSSKHLLLLL